MTQCKTKELLDALNELHSFLEQEDTSDIKYVMNDLKDMIKILRDQDVLSTKGIDVESRLNGLFPQHGGLTDFFIWRDDVLKRKTDNEAYEQKKRKLWDLLRS